MTRDLIMTKTSLLTKTQITSIFEKLKKANPEPTTELNYTNPYTLLVAVVLSAQTTDINVNKATESLFKIADTPEKMVALGLDAILSSIKTLNLFKTKGRHLYELSQLLIEKHQSQVPNNREALEALPGVGRKTANVVLNTLFDLPCIAVDTHIFRLANRIGFVTEKTREKTEASLMKVVPNAYLKDAHHWLILHGRYVCTAKKPKCSICIIRDECKYPDKTI
jgi:endonuclease-3